MGEHGTAIRVDVHTHTAASYDSEAAPAALLRAAERAGLDGVAVTDHDTVRGARIAADLAADYEPFVVVGCEVSTADGHLLALGVDGAPEPGRPLAATARSVREAGGVAVVPHPFQRSRHGAAASAIAAVDGIEVYNAHALTGIRNGQARRFAASEGYPAFGGSDAHRPGAVGRAATRVGLPAGADPAPGVAVEAMRAGRTAAVGRRVPARAVLDRVVATARLRTPSLR